MGGGGAKRRERDRSRIRQRDTSLDSGTRLTQNVEQSVGPRAHPHPPSALRAQQQRHLNTLPHCSYFCWKQGSENITRTRVSLLWKYQQILLAHCSQGCPSTSILYLLKWELCFIINQFYFIFINPLKCSYVIAIQTRLSKS